MKIKTCEYCDKNILLKTKQSYSAHLGKCGVFRKKRIDILNSVTKEYLRKEHINKSLSLGQVAKNLGLHHTRELRLKLIEFGLPFQKYNSNEEHSKSRIKLMRETNKKKYGCDFHLSTEKSKKRIKKTIKKKYGVSNVFQTVFVKDKIMNTCLKKYGFKYASSSLVFKEKVKKTCLKKYGVDNVFKRFDVIKSIKEKRLKNGKNFYSEQSQRLFNFIFGCLSCLECYNKKTIYYASLNKEFGKRGSTKYYFYDFVIPHLKFCIEYNGDYYHANPRKYNSENLIHNKKAKEIWEYDKEKINHLHKLGFEIWIIWESDFIFATDFYFSKILRRINSLNNIPKLERIIFESNLEKDLETWNNAKKENLYV